MTLSSAHREASPLQRRSSPILQWLHVLCAPAGFLCSLHSGSTRHHRLRQCFSDLIQSTSLKINFTLKRMSNSACPLASETCTVGNCWDARATCGKLSRPSPPVAIACSWSVRQQRGYQARGISCFALFRTMAISLVDSLILTVRHNTSCLLTATASPLLLGLMHIVALR